MPRYGRICRLLLCGWIASGIVFPIGCANQFAGHPAWDDASMEQLASSPENKHLRESAALNAAGVVAPCKCANCK